jgi:hypothetical protein
VSLTVFACLCLCVCPCLCVTWGKQWEKKVRLQSTCEERPSVRRPIPTCPCPITADCARAPHARPVPPSHPARAPSSSPWAGHVCLVVVVDAGAAQRIDHADLCAHVVNRVFPEQLFACHVLLRRHCLGPSPVRQQPHNHTYAPPHTHRSAAGDIEVCVHVGLCACMRVCIRLCARKRLRMGGRAWVRIEALHGAWVHTDPRQERSRQCRPTRAIATSSAGTS